jgi:polyisoprenoid-binding protein YceI
MQGKPKEVFKIRNRLFGFTKKQFAGFNQSFSFITFSQLLGLYRLRINSQYPNKSLEVKMSWKIDPAHSEVTFVARHMMISKVRGQFDTFGGTVEFDETNPENTLVDVQIEAASINTRETQRDTHLRSPDFFYAEKYPYLVFRSNKVELTGKNRARLIGDLTIRDVTHEVALDVQYAGKAKSPMGSTSAGFSAQTRINREDWGLNWNVALETGGWLVGKEIDINIEVELIKQAEPAYQAAA